MFGVSWPRFLFVALAFLGTAAILRMRDRAETVPPYRLLSTFPMQIGDWQATELSMSRDELEVLGPGEFLLRDYTSSPMNAPVNLFIAFFPSQRTGDTIHSPRNCLPGSGWTPTEYVRIPVQRSDGSSIVINQYIVAKAMDRVLVLYWYQAHGRVTPSEYWAKAFLVADSVRLNRTDGALVRVISPIPSRGSIEVAQTTALKFVHQILPMLDDYIPR